MGVDNMIAVGRPSCNMRLIASVNDALSLGTRQYLRLGDRPSPPNRPM